jgi:hypothetical protein
MGDIRELIEGDLKETLEGDFGLPVELLNPDTGIWQTESANEPGTLLQGQILYDSIIRDPNTGLDIVVHKPVVSLRRSSLAVVPDATPGKNWAVRIPLEPSASAPKVTFRIGRVTEGGDSIGFVRLYLERIEQAP